MIRESRNKCNGEILGLWQASRRDAAGFRRRPSAEALGILAGGPPGPVFVGEPGPGFFLQSIGGRGPQGSPGCPARSGEGRVGKEGRSRGAPDHFKKKKEWE